MTKDCGKSGTFAKMPFISVENCASTVIGILVLERVVVGKDLGWVVKEPSTEPDLEQGIA